jgi:hypothetical protein
MKVFNQNLLKCALRMKLLSPKIQGSVSISVAKKSTLTPWLESANKLYRPSDRRLSAKLVPTFTDRGVFCAVRAGAT